MSDDLEGFLGGGPPGLKFPTKGTSYTLTLTGPPRMQQQQDFDTGELLEWPDGNPRMQMVIPGTIPEDEWWDEYDDDNEGEARLFVKSGMRVALRDGLKRAKAKVADLDEDAVLEITYVKDGPREGRKQPPKIYKIDVLELPKKKPSKGAAEFLDEDDEDEEEEAPAPKRRRRAAPADEDEAPPKRRRRATPVEEDDEDEEEAPPRRRRKTNVTEEVATAKRNAAKRSAAAAKKRAAEDDDEEDDDEPPF
jgi:hypothetical protein